MKRKNCKITIEYVQNNPCYQNVRKVTNVYTFNDYRICNSVMNLLDCINSKWIRKEHYYE